MDPDATLTDIRSLVDAILGEDSPGDPVLMGQELAEKVEALDTWILNGGFLPKSWGPTGIATHIAERES